MRTLCTSIKLTPNVLSVFVLATVFIVFGYMYTNNKPVLTKEIEAEDRFHGVRPNTENKGVFRYNNIARRPERQAWKAKHPRRNTQLSPGIQRYIDEIVSNQKHVTTKEKVNEVRILCLILTSQLTIGSRVAAVNATWARRCDRHFYVLKTEEKASDIINTPFEETRNNIVHKIKFALTHIQVNHNGEFDWLIKADDDTYVIIENLKFLLQKHDSKLPGYLGFHFNKFVASGYMSGGAGYVISNSGLQRLVNFGFYQEKCPVVPNVEDPENSEDIEIGRCLNKTGVPVINSLDEEGKERFHPYPVQKHLLGSIPQFVFEWAKNKHKEGMGCCSKYSISFHYMDPATMLLVDHLLYRTSVYGLHTVDSKVL